MDREDFFEVYYAKIVTLLRERGLTQMPDRDTVEQDFVDDKTPEESAFEFAADWDVD